LVRVSYTAKNFTEEEKIKMKKRILTIKVTEDELDAIQENYKEFIMEFKKPWSRHKWMRFLLLDESKEVDGCFHMNIS